MRILAVVNQKGGVGKTTVTLGLASAAQAAGLRTLVIDLDPQANATAGLGLWDPTETVDDALAADDLGSLKTCIVNSGWPTGPGRVVDVAPSTPRLAQREPILATDPIGAQDRLRLALDGCSYDLVLIDCPPSLGLLTVNALFASTDLLVVTEPAAWSSDGVEQILANARRIAARRDGSPRLAGIVINRLARTRDAGYWRDQLVEQHGDSIIGVIRQRAAITEAAAQSLPIHGLKRTGADEAMVEFDGLLKALNL